MQREIVCNEHKAAIPGHALLFIAPILDLTNNTTRVEIRPTGH